MAAPRQAPRLGNLNTCETIALFLLNTAINATLVRVDPLLREMAALGTTWDVQVLETSLDTACKAPIEVETALFFGDWTPELNTVRTHCSNMQHENFCNRGRVLAMYLRSDYSAQLKHVVQRMPNAPENILITLISKFWKSLTCGDRTAIKVDDHKFIIQDRPEGRRLRHIIVSQINVSVKLAPRFVDDAIFQVLSEL